MAFTLRLEEKHDAILDRLCEQLELKTKSKVVLWLIENFENCDRERLQLHKDLIQKERELVEIKRNVKALLRAQKDAEELTGILNLIV